MHLKLAEGGQIHLTQIISLVIHHTICIVSRATAMPMIKIFTKSQHSFRPIPILTHNDLIPFNWEQSSKFKVQFKLTDQKETHPERLQIQREIIMPCGWYVDK